MIVLILLVVLLVVAGGAGLLGAGALSADNRRERTGLLALLSAPVALLAGAVLVAVVMVGLGGLRSGDEPETAPASAPADRPRPQGDLPPPPAARVLSGTPSTPTIVMRAGDHGRFPDYRPVSGLAPNGVVRVQVEGFGWHERGSVRQCVVELGHQTACGEPFPVQFDGDGRADFQFAVRGDIAPGGCRAGQPTCLLRVSGESPDRDVSVQTVLVDVLNQGEVRLEPAGPVADGGTVDVVVSGFPPGTTATAILCAPPESYDARRCRPPEPASTFIVDATGAGRTALAVASGRVGSEAASCGSRSLCGIAVVVENGFVVAPVAEVRFSRGPGVRYDSGRVLPGVSIAVVLLLTAVAVARRTDWMKPTEAATEELDGSDLRTGQSLDDLFGTDLELDERDPILW